MEILRVCVRTCLILVIAGIVIVITNQLTPDSGPSLAVAKEMSRPALVGDVATPGGEDALRRLIADVQENRSIQAPLNACLSDSIRRILPRNRQILERLGPLQSITYQGADSEGDRYRTVFKNGSLTWTITLRRGVLDRLWFVAPEGPKPQDWIDWYALLPVDNGISRFIFGLIKLSVIVTLGLIIGLRV